MTCEASQDSVPVWYQVRIPGDNKTFGPVVTAQDAQELLITVVAAGAAQAVIEKTSTGPQLITGA